MTKLVALLVVAALAVPALVLAAKPRPGAAYSRDGVIALNVDPNGKRMYVKGKTRCGKKLGPRDLPPVKIGTGGKFKLRMYRIPGRNGKVSVELEGRFVTRDAAKGTVMFQVGKCRDKPTEFTAPIVE